MYSQHTNNYPKILVIDHSPFNRKHNNGIVKSNLFQDWPKDRLAQIMYSNLRPSFDVCSHYWEIQKKDILKGIIRIAPNKQMPSQSFRDETATIPHPVAIKKNNRTQLSIHIKQVVGDLLFEYSSIVSKPLKLWITVFQPDIIFTLGGSYRIIRLATQIAQRYKLPILPFFTDDWICTLYDDYFFEQWNRRKILYWFNRCLDNSPIRMTISEAMSKEYKNRYGGHFEVFMNIVEAQFIQKKSAVSHNRDKIVHFSYLGSVALDRWRMLRKIGIALRKLRDKGILGELTIYTFAEDIRKVGHELDLEPVMRVAGTARPEQVPQLQNEADVLVHVESFDDKMRKYTKYSLSTKIPQYMMAGNCILGFGPPEAASIQYLKNSNAAITICDMDSENIENALKTAIENPELRLRHGAAAHDIAMNKHEASKQRERFRQIVYEACQLWRKGRKLTN